jgi:hypothetical protein
MLMPRVLLRLVAACPTTEKLAFAESQLLRRVVLRYNTSLIGSGVSFEIWFRLFAGASTLPLRCKIQKKRQLAAITFCH